MRASKELSTARRDFRRVAIAIAKADTEDDRRLCERERQRIVHTIATLLGHVVLMQRTVAECTRCPARGTFHEGLNGPIFHVACGSEAA